MISSTLASNWLDGTGCALPPLPPSPLLTPPPSTPRPLIDRNGRIIAVLAGQPHNKAYAAATQRAFRAISQAGADARFPPQMRSHRRGLFAAINVGISYGKGQRTPGWLRNKEYDGLADGLLANEDTGRMASFADAAFALWAPRLYRHYRDCDESLRTHHPQLRRPFSRSVFFCAAFNFGPSVWTFKHRDVLNLAFGWCAVQALGEFDSTKGGHLVLWDMQLVIEFPAGRSQCAAFAKICLTSPQSASHQIHLGPPSCLSSSATIAHSNVPVQKEEKRASFTQFSAGGIFRYVDNGFRTVEQLEDEDPAEYGRLMAKKASRWTEGLELFSTLDELTCEVEENCL
ncbi:hypothetical protein B0H12DRAFT_1269142 [Mycena haematopus]|nr:hypothetical protein B0H12DRAFT_1269142 [Mycena haematopus]